MVDSVLYQIGKMKWIFVIDFSIIIFFCALLVFLTRKFSWKKRKVRLFSILYNINEKQAACVGLIIGRICFVLTSILYPKDIVIGHLIVMLLFDIAILALTLNLKVFIIDSISFTIIFFLLYINMTLWRFYRVIDSNILILIMVISTGFFILVYTLMQSLNCYEGILSSKKIKAKGEINA